MAQNRRFVAYRANFFTEMPVEGRCWASFFAPIGPASVLDVARRTSGWLWWGFCSIRSWLAEYLRRVAALMMQFPPVWWRRSRESRGCGRQSADPLGEKSPKTTVSGEWVYDLAELIAVVVRCSRVTPRTAPQSLVAHSPACRGINRLTSCESCYTTVLSSNEAKSGRG